MSAKEIKNIGQSVRNKLLNVARETKRTLDSVTLQYFQERFLYRLSCSPYKDHFILKGGLLFWVMQQNAARPTKDIDFSGVDIPGSEKEISAIFQEITRIEQNDGLNFEDEITTEEITADAEYKGIRVFIPVTLTTIRKKLQIDIGFGDVITEYPKAYNFPVLTDQPVPKLLSYPPETVVSEKLQAIAYLGYTNSRFKDFYDIIKLMQLYEFEGKALKKAIEKTFDKRETTLNELEKLYDGSLVENMGDKGWNAFLKKATCDEKISFADAVGNITGFIKPVLENEDPMKWNTQSQRWD